MPPSFELVDYPIRQSSEEIKFKWLHLLTRRQIKILLNDLGRDKVRVIQLILRT